MTIQDLGSIGELVAAIATVATLIYLALQIKQNTSTVATSTYDSVMNGYNEINLTIASDPELARILDAGLSDPDSLSENEQTRFILLLRTASNHYLKLLRLKEKRAFPATEWELYAREMAQIYRTPGGLRFREVHLNYSDLYRATDEVEVVDVSAWQFRSSDAEE